MDDDAILKLQSLAGESHKRLQPMREKLRNPFPEEALKPYKKSNKPNAPKLTTISQMYVIERLNEVFGMDGWSFDYVLWDRETTQFADVTLEIHHLDLKKSVKYTGGAAFFMGSDAPKSAITDGLTKAASILEIGIDVFKGHNELNAGSTTVTEVKQTTASLPIKDETTGLGKCSKCGAANKRSSAGNIYCSATCWTK